MSQVYSTEPQTAGRVIFETTHGPLDIQLWSRECPATTKYFLQLCSDGFYDNVLFHRIMPNFLVQTGILRYNPISGLKKKSNKTPKVTSLNHNDLREYRQRTLAEEALERRQYEINTRIRFNHRGQVAMALPMEADNTTVGEEEMAVLQPQLFITLDDASELDGKHVCFGTVTGPTIFNALRIGNTDVDSQTGQPTILEEAPRIERVKIVENPIHTNLLPTRGITLPWQVNSAITGDGDGENAASALIKKKRKRKAIKNINVLSFGDEMLELDEPSDKITKGSRIKSSHDLVESKRLSKEVDKKLIEVVGKDEILKTTKSEEEGEKEASIQEKLKGKNLKQKNLQQDASWKEKISDGADINNTTPVIKFKSKSQQEEVKSIPTPVPQDSDMPKSEKAPKVSLVEARRAKYAKKGNIKDKRKREETTMSKFMAFQSKVSTKKGKKKDSLSLENGNDNHTEGIAYRMAKRAEASLESNQDGESNVKEAPAYHGQILEGNDDDGTELDWMKTKFKCRKHQDLDLKLGGDGRNAMEDYEVVDERDRSRHGGKINHRRHQKGR